MLQVIHSPISAFMRRFISQARAVFRSRHNHFAGVIGLEKP